MKKLLMVAFAALLLTCSVCLAQEADVRVCTLSGPTGIGMTGIMRDNDGTYDFTIATAPDQIVAAIAGGSADIAACPTNLAATLYQKTNGGVKLLALNTLGVLHVVTSDESIQSVQDLAGHTVYATGQGAMPEYALAYILEQNGLSDSVSVEYLAEHSELATKLAAGEVDIGILPEPHVTSAIAQNGKLRRALDVTDLFEDAARADDNEDMVLSMGCVIARSEWVADHPDQVNAFLNAYKASVDWVNADPEAASAEVEEQGVMPKAAVAKDAIPNCHIVFVEGEAMRAQIEPLYRLLFDANPQSVGGALPDDDFYYAR